MIAELNPYSAMKDSCVERLEEVKNYMPPQGIIVEVCDDNLGGKGSQQSMRHLLKVLRDTWGRMSLLG